MSFRDLSVTRKPVSQPTERNTNFDSMRPQKGEFVCQKCIQRKPFVTFGPSPKCRGCNSNEQTTPLCRRCKNPFTFWRQEHQWICRYCSDIRDVSREAASGQRSDITPLRQTRKGKKYSFSSWNFIYTIIHIFDLNIEHFRSIYSRLIVLHVSELLWTFEKWDVV